MVNSLFDQYDRGRMTRRNLVQALAALVPPTSTLAPSAPRWRMGYGQHRQTSLRRSRDSYPFV
jgi:hypothetical protein